MTQISDTESPLLIFGPDLESVTKKETWVQKIKKHKTAAFVALTTISVPAFGMYDGGPTESLIDGLAVEDVFGDIAKHPAPILAIVGISSWLGYRAGLSERRAQALGFGVAIAANIGMEVVGGYMEHKGLSLGSTLDVFRSHEFRGSDVVGGVGIAAVGALVAPPFIGRET